MMPFKFRFISTYLLQMMVFASLLALFFRCNTNTGHQTDGGPCIYNRDTTEARVVDIYPVNAKGTYYEVAFATTTDASPDTLYYSSQFSGHLSKQELDSFGFAIGQGYAYEHCSIVSGTCSPDIYTLLLTRYVKN